MDRISRQDGRFVVDADLLGPAFGLDPALVPGLMQQGRITSRHETGEGADAGTFRLSFFHAGRVLRLTVDAEGRILKQARFDRPERPGGAG
ncbi:DUF6522 family protein [Paracoccus simplex]|uniref:DUF6522 family protein n=1 Tax=Paracoccus simplex TaxID=2086346 RepID=A0ABV7RXE6_9RHOB